jgi:hypothetical protein
MQPKGIVVHYVGNPRSTAMANRNYFNSSGVASAHYIIDMSGEIVQAIPDNEVAWHAGRSYGSKWNAMAKTNNYRFIGIECCHPDAAGKFTDATRAALIELCVDLCRKYGLNPETDIYRHYDVCGKQCPLYYVKNSGEWDGLKADIVNAFAPVTAISYPIIAAPSVMPPQMRDWADAKKSAEFFVENANLYYDVSLSAGVDPAVSYAQSYLETGGGRFGGILDASYCNPCGMKKGSGGLDQDASVYTRFPDWQTGIQAQVDHLALYAGAPGYPKADTPDPRHFAFIEGTAPTVNDLTGKWAVDPCYAQKITALIDEMITTAV